jgi:hypothetical protein
MNRAIFILALTVLAAPIFCFGQIAATATISMTGVDSGNGDNKYSAVLNNTGTTTVGTFWFSWTPGQDFMHSPPVDIASPTGWTAAVTHGGGSDGYAIQWKATSAPSDLASGGTLTGFTFESPDSPTALAGDSTFYPGTPVGTSFVYEGAPFSDPGDQFVATVVTPEPASLGLLAAGAMLILRRRVRRIA